MREEDGTQTFSVSQAGSVRALAKDEVCEGCELDPRTGCSGKVISVGDTYQVGLIVSSAQTQGNFCQGATHQT